MPSPDAFPDIDLCRAAYSRNLTGEPLQTTFDAYTRTRRKTRRRWVTDTVCWLCTEQQCIELEQFHRQMGGDWFAIDLPDWQGLSSTVASFASALTIKPIRDYYEITAELSVPSPSIIPEDELEMACLAIIGITGPGFETRLNTLINHTMPEL